MHGEIKSGGLEMELMAKLLIIMIHCARPHFFTVWLFLIRYHFFCKYMVKLYGQLLGFLLICLFSVPQVYNAEQGKGSGRIM